MKKLLLLLLLCTAIGTTFADGQRFRTAAGDVQIDFCTPGMFRVRYSRGSTFAPDETWMVRRYNFPAVGCERRELGNGRTLLRTDSLDITVYTRPFRLEVADRRGKLLYAERTDERFRKDSVQTTVTMQPDEHFFGFGERMDFLDRRGHKIRLNVELGRGSKPAVGGKDILRANYCPVPFMMSTRGYGIFFHTGYPTDWDMGWTNPAAYSFAASGGELDYYFVYGPDFYTMLDLYTELTGKAPMLPRFAMGLHVGTYSGGTWKNEEKTSDRYPVELARRLRKEGIPFDLLWLDSTWRMFTSYGNGGCCFEWRETFKDPARMFADCYAENVQMVGLHIRSILDNGPQYRLLDQARKQGNVLYPNAVTEGVVNFFDPKAVDWWWKEGVMKVASIGARFVKTDVGGTMRLKPEAPNYKESDMLHNIYPLAYAEAPFLKFQEYNNMRGLTHTREGYAGIQRYPYIWAGDWGSEWQWFEPVIRAGLNIGMSGVGNWTHCMGGFEQYSPYDTELYMRWVQFGMLSPIAMVFGMDHPRYHEPWTYGKEAMENFIKYDSLRYTLIPYIYSNAYRLHRTGRPMMTPLVMDYPQDENTYQIARQYMFGPWMMVCPVTTKGALSQYVYFPGGKWMDYDTGEIIEGRQYKSFLTPVDVLPIYIKAGAIIPQQPAMQWVDQHPVKEITLDVFPSGASSFDMYEDDGRSRDYERGICAITHIGSRLEAGNWMLRIEKPVGSYTPEQHTYLVKARLDGKPTTVTENGKVLAASAEGSIGWWYDEAKHCLWVKPRGDNRGTIEIKATF